MTLAILKKPAIMDLEQGRFVHVQTHHFADIDKVWVPLDSNFTEMLVLALPNDSLRAAASITCDGEEVTLTQFFDVPPAKSYIEITLSLIHI